MFLLHNYEIAIIELGSYFLLHDIKQKLHIFQKLDITFAYIYNIIHNYQYMKNQNTFMQSLKASYIIIYFFYIFT